MCDLVNDDAAEEQRQLERPHERFTPKLRHGFLHFPLSGEQRDLAVQLAFGNAIHGTVRNGL